MKFPMVGKSGVLLIACTLICACGKPSTPRAIDDTLASRSIHPDAESVACAKCHQSVFDEWVGSQHANANRLVSDSEDRTAFDPTVEITHGSFVTKMQKNRSGDFEFINSFSNRPPETFTAEAVIAISPLRQYLVSFPGGRLQVMDLAYDPRSNEWFNAFGEENRQPHEWGHWKGRSMTWNVQCAFCHTTGFEKNYDIKEDRYASTWKAMGISCTQCHAVEVPSSEFKVHSSDGCPVIKSSPPNEDIQNPESDIQSPASRFMDNCASCHARREELFGTFKPGDSFHDHYRLSLPDQPGLFYADGQVLEEDFEYSSFMMSRMGHKGVTCLDCHNPHSGKLTASIEDNSLCMKCHTPPGLNGATPIDPVGHSFHKTGTPGSRCVDCHMPENFYMVRDPRRDHGFTSPDPLLTIEHGIPNACNRCHQDQTPQWAAETTDTWYGDKMNRRARERARAVARYHEGDNTVSAQLLDLAASEEIDAWRAALVSMLQIWNDQPQVREFLQDETSHASPHVRSAAIRSLQDAPAEALSDTSALVRVDAAMEQLRRNPANKPPAYEELLAYINNISDQPAGALRQSQLAMIEGRQDDAEQWAEKALAWDPSSVPLYTLGRLMHIRGNMSGAISNMFSAAMMDEQNAEYAYSLALVIAETGDNDMTILWLEETLHRDRQFGRAWYNLGLAYSQASRLDEAVEALKMAESLMPGSADPAYARATIHFRLEEKNEAVAALNAALQQDPAHEPSRAMLRQMSVR